MMNHAVRFNRARNNLLAVVVFTTINILLLAFYIDLSFLFSAFVPQILQIVAHEFNVVAGLIFGLVPTAFYLLFYALSKKWRGFILVALIFFIIDALLMVGFILLTGLFADFLFNIAFHAWILYYLITGTAAWSKLRAVTPGEIIQIQQGAAQQAQAEEIASALKVISHTPDGDSNGETESYPGQFPPTGQQAAGEAGFQQNGYTHETGNTYVLDDFVRTSIFASFTSAEKLYLFNDIPYDKLENAKNSYAPMLGADETVILLYDDTVGGSANEGFILTTKHLYSKNYGFAGSAMYVSDINDLYVPKFGMVSTHVTVSSARGIGMEIHISKTKAKAEEVYSSLKKVIDLLKTQAGCV